MEKLTLITMFIAAFLIGYSWEMAELPLLVAVSYKVCSVYLNNWVWLYAIMVVVNPFPSFYNKVMVSATPTRQKREGFGPFEAQETWDEKGKSNLAPMIAAVVQEIKRESMVIEEILNATMQIIEHPLEAMTHSKTGLAIIAIVAIALAIAIICLIIYIWPAFECLGNALWCIFSFIPRTIYRAALKFKCTMRLCSWSPFVWARNARIRRQIAKEDASLGLLKDDVIPRTHRVWKALSYDDYGPHVVNGNTKIYIEKENIVEAVVSAPPKRVQGGPSSSGKETYIHTSKPRPVSKLPDFQGCFKVDDIVVGHFSRIKWDGKDCILTAFHVLSYNMNSILKICKDDREIAFHEIRAQLVAASPSSDLDYVIMEIPPVVFSKLQMKVGKVTARLAIGSPIAIYQYEDGLPVRTSSIATTGKKPWHIDYKATTFVGTSGAPILDLHQNIVGVHIESCVERDCNTGIIPPFLRNKESYINADLMANQPDYKYANWDYEDLKQKQAEDAADRDYFFSTVVFKDRDITVLEGKRDWANEVQMIEDEIEARFDIDTNPRFANYMKSRANLYLVHAPKWKGTDASGSHVGREIKGGRLRKESPWCCSKCGLLHLKAGYNCQECGYSLIKPKEAKVAKTEAAKAAVAEMPLPLEIKDIIEKHIMEYLQKQFNIADVIDKQLANKLAKETIQKSELPKKVEITKDLKQAMNVASSIQDSKLVTHGPKHLWGLEKVDEETAKGPLVKQVQKQVMTVREAEKKNVSPYQLQDTEIVTEVEVKKKRKNRRRKNKKQQVVEEPAQQAVAKPVPKGPVETKPSTSGVKVQTKQANKETAPVHLNSQTPSKDGDNTINGLNINRSQQNPLL